MRADLNDIDIVEQRQLRQIHDFSDYRHAGQLLCLEQELETLCAQSLESVGRGAGLERAAAKQSCAGLLNRLRDTAYLLF